MTGTSNDRKCATGILLFDKKFELKPFEFPISRPRLYQMLDVAKMHYEAITTLVKISVLVNV